jgi:ribosome maturation factor RimP
MSIAHIKIPGLDEARIVALVEPVLLAHGVVGVELLWKTDNSGWVLIVNIERPDAKKPGEGITVDLCSDISRALSAVLDADEQLIPHAYHLEVGSPGIERNLYLPEDYARFAGYSVKARLRNPVLELRGFRGKVAGVNESGQILFEAEGKAFAVAFEEIKECRLVYDWDSPKVSGEAKAKSPKPHSSERTRGNRASKRNR